MKYYLGIDFGTSGISSVLLNAKSGETYPIYWIKNDRDGSIESSFRLPAIATSDLGNFPLHIENLPANYTDEIIPNTNSQLELAIANFKPYLKLTVPYYSKHTNNWEPVLDWSDTEKLSLYWMQRSLQSLFATLYPDPNNVHGLKVAALGLDEPEINAALSNLSGVVVGCPYNWGDTYRFNVREAILGAKLVSYPQEIFFVEEAIATLLGAFKTDNKKSFKGVTLVIDIGATTTEFALVDLPDNLEKLSYSDFFLYSLPYGGNAINQDIVCQLFLLNSKNDPFSLPFTVFPSLIEPDLENRYRFQQQLNSSLLGKILLEAANIVKLGLQQQEELTLKIGEEICVFNRALLETKILMPFIKAINSEVNSLLSKQGISIETIAQVICTGGAATDRSVQKWLKQKFIYAKLITDNSENLTDKTNNLDIANYPSKIAYGLASLPMYPQVLERSQQQYSDYFLLLELLALFPDKPKGNNRTLPYSLMEIMQLLARRGINTRVCQERLKAILEGNLPDGLSLKAPEAILITQTSRENLDYQAIVAMPLFDKEADELYRPNFQQCDRLRRYLKSILLGTYQQLEDPLLFDL